MIKRLLFILLILLTSVYSFIDIFVITSSFDPILFLMLILLFIFSSHKYDFKIFLKLAFMYILLALLFVAIKNIDSVFIEVNKASTWSFAYLLLASLKIIFNK